MPTALCNSPLDSRFPHPTACLLCPLDYLVVGPKPYFWPLVSPNLLVLQDSSLFVANNKSPGVILYSFLSLTLINSISNLLIFPSKYIQNSLPTSSYYNSFRNCHYMSFYVDNSHSLLFFFLPHTINKII